MMKPGFNMAPTLFWFDGERSGYARNRRFRYDPDIALFTDGRDGSESGS